MFFPSGSSFFGETNSLLRFTEDFFAFLAQHSPPILENLIPQRKGFFQEKNPECLSPAPFSLADKSVTVARANGRVENLLKNWGAARIRILLIEGC
jgi:hypothetical protein